MKKIKQIASIFLVVSMILSLAACGNKATTETETAEAAKAEVDVAKDDEKEAATDNSGKKIAVLCSPLGWGEENERALQKCIDKYGEDKFIVNTMPEDSDVQTITSLCTDAANNPDVAVLVINECCIGSVAGMKAAKEINPDLVIISVLPGDEPIEVAETADLIAMPGFESMGVSAAEAAHAKGLDVIVMEAPADQMGTTVTQRRMAGLQGVCDQYGMELIVNTLPNGGDSNTRNALVQAVKDDVYNKIAQYGDKVGFFPINCFIYVPIITAMTEKQSGYLLGMTDPGPFSPSYCDAFGISAPEEHSMELAWINTAIADACTEAGMSGHFGNWDFSFLSGFMYASVDYAMAYINGDVGNSDVDAWMNFFMESNNIDASEGNLAYEAYTQDGVEYDNLVVVSGKTKFYGEDIK